MVEMRTQKEEILNWLRRIGYITPKDAIALCGCYRLAARISELRADGWPIVTEKSRIKGAGGPCIGFWMIGRCQRRR